MQRSAEDTLRDFFATQPHGASAAWLFGSVARGTNRSTSDVDVGLLLSRAPEGFSGLQLDLGIVRDVVVDLDAIVTADRRWP